ncbi:chemotaxis protein CheA [Selenomonas sp. ND2010]|uniref:chemotaxis protein CheA n=1 Tax=Selenomonas sp. ND2010 TaxID=1410618 RepID=UPI00068C8611|nr:chemotaxis protein CheA [Selenomonas sp. ND2010]
MAENEPMVEVFIYETRQFLEQLEQVALASEDSGSFQPEEVNEVFRAMHTIKGSAAMMLYDEISHLAHAVEDIFFYIRELHPEKIDVSAVTDIVLTAVDFMNGEMDKLDSGAKPDASSEELQKFTHDFLRNFKLENGHDPDVDLRKVKKTAPKETEKAEAAEPAKQQYFIQAVKPEEVKTESGSNHVYKAVLHFDPEGGMVEVRAFGVINRLEDQAGELHYLPEKIIEDETAADTILKEGFKLWFTTGLESEAVRKLLDETMCLTGLELTELSSVAECEYWPTPKQKAAQAVEESSPIVPVKPEAKPRPAPMKQAGHDGHESQMISVRVDKLDRLMELVGEMVIAESMVTQNPDIRGMELSNFDKAARQLHKINGELQDRVMALRMVPLEATFKKMNRIVRDMTKKLGKQAKLVLVGADTEVDKNVTEHIGDPLMHIIRNSIDHGIEMPEVRKEAGKPEQGTVVLSAQNAGGEVVIRIEDDGGGMNRDRIMKKAKEKGILTKPEEEYTDQEVYSFIFAPGFSTKEQVTEFSGRGVGMDVVVSNIKALGGTITVDSNPGKGSVTIIRIPLTLAIVEGMCIKVGGAGYTIPISSIRRSFRPEEGDIFLDVSGQEMFMEAGSPCPIVRLHQLYDIENAREQLTEGILLVTEADDHYLGIFADELVGVQQIVVKPVPGYIQAMTKMTGITGCTILGDGSISLIIDPGKLLGLLVE